MPDVIEPVECWVLTIPNNGVDTVDPEAWSTHVVTVEVYLTFDAYSERCDELKGMGVVSHTRHLITGKRYW